MTVQKTHPMRLLLALLLLGACASAVVRPAATPITTGEELIQAMRDRYEDRWYRNVTFTQENTRPLPDGTNERTTWLEAIEMPSKLRVDVVPRAEGNGFLFADDVQYRFENGKLVRTIPGTHPLLLLGFDAYSLPPSETAAKLRKLGFDLSVLREDQWQGRPVYVVGAAAGDGRTKQFWIDKDRLVFVRMLQPAGKDGTQVAEIRFNKYEPLGGGWISPEVEFLTDGKLTFLEEYKNIRTGETLAPALFDPQQWSAAPHWHVQ